MHIIQEANKIWNKMVEGGTVELTNSQPEILNKLLNIISAGDFYYYIFNVKKAEIEFISPDVENILGYPPSYYTVPFMLNIIHPQDISWFLDFEATGVDFFKSLSIDKVSCYKVRYDFRMKKADGNYIRILHQAITLEQGSSGEVIKSLGIHTDITGIKKEGKPILSFIGLNGEPSFTDVQPKKMFTADEKLSNREREILIHLVNGKSSVQIAKILFISKVTVDTHRRNMLKKTNCTKTTELIKHAVSMGYI